MSTFTTTVVENKLELVLYLHHIYNGDNATQKIVVQPNGVNSFGSIVAQDWPCYNNLDVSGAKLIARAQGTHTMTSKSGALSWYNSFSLLFQDGSRFPGSTLEVKGINVTEGEWSIVGGTGEFTNAQGTIYKSTVKTMANVDIVKITIHATYKPTKAGN
ncbi:hypothetical protein LUZ63_005539 [Rhynchospora breviuscula]|uniref:Dirigent protein n=1 Tax=Rhynchospora breviuscula TaxID=2022672 RepID=A0A9Q0CNQ4_9POAL|nr:hypothetical protein LUZ63_005539 [Rhynchospora breviuscula]